MTFGQLLRLPALGIRSALEISCVVEAIIEVHAAMLGELNSISLDEPHLEWMAELSRIGQEPWTEEISELDPRFRDLLATREKGTIAERIERCLADPASVATIERGRELATVVRRIGTAIAGIEALLLEDSLAELLHAATSNRRNQFDPLAARFGWAGEPPVTLEEASRTIGVTRERVRQIEARFLKGLPTRVFLPKLDAAIELLERSAPLLVPAAEQMLVEHGVCRKRFPIETVIGTAKMLGRETDLEIDDVSQKGRILLGSSDSLATRSVARAARRLAGQSGVSSVFQLLDELTLLSARPNEQAVRAVLHLLPNVEFLNEDWYWVTDIPVRRNRLSNVTKKILSVASPQSLISIRDRIRRAFTYRAKSHARYETLTPPPADVLAAFFRRSPEFKLGDDLVSSVQSLSYLTELGDVDRTLVEVLRATPSGVLDRRSVTQACLARGLNENSISVFLTYSPIVEHVSLDVWKLRGVRVDPAAVEALRQANASSPNEKRLLSFGWHSDGRLWIASRIPYSNAGYVLGVPGSTRRYLSDRKFAAIVKGTRAACGQIAVTETGTSFGYNTFLRIAGADAGDVLLAEFDLAKECVDLSLVDEVVLESESVGG